MEPCPASFNLAEYVLRKAHKHPDKVALSILGPYKSERWSYAKLEHAVRAVGAGLLDLGLIPGDRLLLRLGNGLSFPLAYLGAIAVGIVPIPTSAQLTTAELDRILPSTGFTAVVAEHGIALPSDVSIEIKDTALLAMAKGTPAEFAMGDPERLAYILFTSGTSGQPRAVAHAHRAIWARQMMFDGWYGLRSDDRLLHAGALNWSFTLGTGLLDPWTVGATALIPANGTSIDTLPLLLKRHDASLFAAAPGVLRVLLKEPGKLALTKLRHTLTAGEHLLPSIRDGWEHATGKGLYDAYGLTECSTFLSSNADGARSLTIQPGRKIRLSDDGEISIHRDEIGLMLGYLEGDEMRLPLTEDHFMTGDRMTQAESGTLAYEGRVDDMMNCGGYRVSPLEVESVLASVPAIGDVAVCSVPINDASIIAAFYTGNPTMDEQGIRAYLADSLARYKQPRSILRVAELPRKTNGKLQRKALPDLWRAHQ